MIRIQPSAFFLLAALILLLPLDWLIAALLAAAIHELGHLAVLHAFGGHAESISIEGAGTRINMGPLENREEFLCAAAGPAASFLLISLCRFFPKLAFCALVQGMFNLLPVHPMDGGRMLRCFLCWRCPRQVEGISNLVERLILFGFFALSLVLVICRRGGILPALVCVTILSRLLFTKIPCKSS